MKVVLDTNVLVSALINADGIPAKITALVLNGKIKILYDNRIIFEYIDVLSRKDFGFDVDTINSLIGYFQNDGEFVNSEFINAKFTDETDRKFYEVYKSGNAQYLITGNLKHFPKENNIILPRKFMDRA